MKTKTYALIAAAGESRRMGSINKVLMELRGKPLIIWTLEAFEQTPEIDEIIVIGNSEWLEEYRMTIAKYHFKKVIDVIVGGKERQDSVYCGLKRALQAGANEQDYICVHNGANCLITSEEITAAISGAQETGASVAAFPAQDTIKEVGDDLFVVRTLERKKLWQMQTPQTLRVDIACRAFAAAEEAKFYGTDDVQLAERIGVPVKIVRCSVKNRKVTTIEDAQFCELVLREREKECFVSDSDKIATSSAQRQSL